MKQNISILEIQDKIARDGVKHYTRFKTNLGWVTCFDKLVIDEIKKHIGKIITAEVSIDEERGYKTVHQYLGESADQTSIPTTTFKPNGNGNGADTMMCTSYAKDIFISLLNHDQMIKLTSQSKTEETEGTLSLKMHNAIELVKQAKGAFQ